MDNENEDSDIYDTANETADSDDCSGDESQNILENLLTDVGGEDGDVDYLEEMVNQAIENDQDFEQTNFSILDAFEGTVNYQYSDLMNILKLK